MLVLASKLKNDIHIRRFFKNSISVILGSFASKLITLASGFVLAYLLGKIGFGRIGVIQGTVALFMSFAGLGLGSCASKYVAELKVKDSIRAGNIIAMTTVVSWIAAGIVGLAMALFASTIATSMLGGKFYINCAYAGALLLALNAVNGAQQGVLSGLGAFGNLMIANVLSASLSIIFASVGAYIWKENGALVGMCIAAITVNIYSKICINQKTKDVHIEIHIPRWMNEWKLLLKFSLPSIASGLFVAGANWYGMKRLVSQYEGLGDMGVLNVANQWKLLVMAVPNMLAVIVLPMLSEAHGINDKKAKIHIFWINMLINIGSGLFVCLLLLLAGNQIMSVIGKGFKGHQDIVVIVAFTGIIVGANNLVSRWLLSGGNMLQFILSDSSWGISFVIASLILISPGRGAIGFAMALLIASISQILTQLFIFSWPILRRKTAYA